MFQHVASGTPAVSYLTVRRPRWYDHLCHYNPTSIIWRYAAITDRRLRATSWTAQDLAASNAIFWTVKGWDGGEAMVYIAAPHCLRYPDSTHVELISLTMLKTIITTLQGVSALYVLIGGRTSATVPGVSLHLFGLDAIFFPLAILGLLRLFATTWLTQDFLYGGYSVPRDDAMGKLLLQNMRYLPTAQNTTDLDLETSHLHNNLDPFLTTPPQHTKFTPPWKSWNSRLFRLFFLLVLGGVWSIALLWMLPVGGGQFTTTSFIMSFFYVVFTTVSFVLYAYYFARGQTITTVLPCLSTTWYRLYTLVIIGLMLALVVVASIETNKSDDGYTSEPMEVELRCARSQGVPSLLLFKPNSYLDAAIASATNPTDIDSYTGLSVQALQSDNATFAETYWLYNFTGYCVGNINDIRLT
jgi:hypothetical protein